MKTLLIALIFLVLYTYIFYPLILIIISSIKNKGASAKGWEKEFYCPAVSMVISAYNEENNMMEKKENFLSFDYPKEKIELVIGSDGSSDSTAESVRSFPDERIKFFEFDKRRGKTAVLNDIVKEAKGEIILFSDGDTIYDRDAIKNLARHFADNGVGGVCGRLELYETADSLAGEGLYWRYENYIKEKESRIRTIVGINGQIFAIRKELFEVLPEDTITEDQVLGMKILARGYNILFDKEAIAKERIGSPKEEFERRIRISAGNFQSIFLSKGVLNPRLGFASFALWSHKILRWFVPFFLIAIFISNIFLLRVPFFKILFFAQILFYLIAPLHYILSKTHLDVKMFRVTAYFIIMNLAILIGFVKFLTRTQKVTWQKVV